MGIMVPMIRERSFQEPSELVIWSATALLGVLLGLGVAFMLWAQIHRTGEPALLDAAVFAMGLGLGLVGLALRNLTPRIFSVALGVALLLAFFTLGGVFSTLAG